jgi:glutathione synthase
VRSLFVMDPLERIAVRSDSTCALMRSATARGDAPWFTTPDRLWWRTGVAGARAAPCPTTGDPARFEPGPFEDVPLSAFDVVWMRKDPPVDDAFLAATRLLCCAPVPVVNDPRGLLRVHEKWWAVERFSRFMPPTLVSSRPSDVRAFVDEVGPAVLKPLDGNGGRGVFRTGPGDGNLPAMVEMLTSEGRVPLMAQRFVSEVAAGDKRILLFDGHPAGAVNRVPQAGDHRANLHVGGMAVATVLTERDREICDALGPALRALGQVFVGIDVIGPWLTEINVTSPTGLQEAGRFSGRDLAGELLDVVEDWRHRPHGEA